MSDELPLTHDITRARGDTRRIPVQLTTTDAQPLNLTAWSNFLLTVATSPNPEDNTLQVMQISGTVIDATAGRVIFIPPGTTDAGVYFYDIQALDQNGEKITLLKGKYTLRQDVTKD